MTEEELEREFIERLRGPMPGETEDCIDEFTLGLYVRARLPGEETSDIEEHLEVCQECHAYTRHETIEYKIEMQGRPRLLTEAEFEAIADAYWF